MTLAAFRSLWCHNNSLASVTLPSGDIEDRLELQLHLSALPPDFPDTASSAMCHERILTYLLTWPGKQFSTCMPTLLSQHSSADCT